MKKTVMKKKGRILGGALNAALKLLIIFLIEYPFIWMVFTSFKQYKDTTIYPPAPYQLDNRRVCKGVGNGGCGNVS